MLIKVDENDPRPIYAQIVSDVKDQIRQGMLRPGDELPSVREMAELLGVNLHTVHRAYQKLRDQGVVRFRLGQRAKVSQLRSSPVDDEQIRLQIAEPLSRLITEAYHLGLSASDFKDMVEELLNEDSEGRENR